MRRPTAPVGAEGLCSAGYRIVKVAEGGGWKAWRRLNHVVWEAHNGPIPKGYRLQFKDRNRLNCDISNLEIITNVQNMANNSILRFPAPVNSTIRILAKLRRLIVEKQNHGPA